MKKALYTAVLLAAVTANVRPQSAGIPEKDSLKGCQAKFEYYYNDSLRTFAEAYPYQFLDLSAGDVVSWFWDFGDGTTSRERNPLHFYQHAWDTVKVCLSITTSDYCTSTYCETFIVSSPEMPHECMVSFYAYRDSTVNCLCMRFRSYSNNEAIAWHWDFGDGTTSEEADPLHQFPAFGYYDVCLTVDQADGQSCTYCQTVHWGNDTIPADCTTSYEVMTLESYPPQYRFVPHTSDTVAWYFWNFGDGEQSPEPSPVHTYKYSGHYTVCLTTKTFTGCKSNYCTTQYYTGGSRECHALWKAYPDRAKPDAADSLPRPCPTCYVFYDLSSGTPDSWHWTFGDGKESFEQNPHHDFRNPGIYTVCLEIITADSCSDLYCDSVYAGIPGPCSLYGKVVDYTGLDGCGLLIELDNGEVLEPVEIIPDFSLRAGQRVALSYNEVPSPSICMVGKTVQITCIREAYRCHAAFRFYALPWVSSWPPIYQFETDSSQHIISWEWDLGDGTVTRERSPRHRYTYTGYYTVCLTIMTADGCTDTRCETAYFEGYNSRPGLCSYKLAIQVEMIIGAPVACDGNASARLIDAWGNAVQAEAYLWSTGSRENSVSNLCPNTEYWVTVTGVDGCSVTGSFWYYGSAPAPDDSSRSNWSYEKTGTNFNFNVPEYGEGYSCIWDFGDGTTAEGFNVFHNYAEEGEYLVVVAVYDPEGSMVFRKEFNVNTGDTTGIAQLSGSEKILVYPVPADEILHIALSLVTTEPLHLDIYNPSGQLVIAKAFGVTAGPVTLSVDVSELAAGVYYGTVWSDAAASQTFRFIK